MSDPAVDIDSERTTIMNKLASNCGALTDLKERLAEVENRLCSLRPQPIAQPSMPDVDDNVEALVDTQTVMIHKNLETTMRILNRLV